MKAQAEETIEFERRIEARPETVFAYFTDPERFVKWQGFDAEIDPRPGGIFRVTQSGHSRVVARGEFVEVEPPRRIVFSWGWEQMEALPEGFSVLPGSSTVEIDLLPDGDSTILRLRHSGLPSVATREVHGLGWRLSLERLVAVATGREPGPNPFANI